MKSNNTIALTIVILLTLTLFACQNETTGKTWSFGIDKGLNVVRIENHSDALLHYLKAGYKNRAVIHIDAHDDSRYIEDGKIEEMEKLASAGEYETLKEQSGISYASLTPKLYNIGNFLYAAYKLGIVKEVYWVMPANEIRLDHPEHVRKYLRRVGFSEESANSFKVVDGYLRGHRNGLPTILCLQSDIPALNEPALISLDIDYFYAFFKNNVETPMLDLTLKLYNNLKLQNITTDSVIISYSVNGMTMPLMHKYTADYLYAAAKDPAIVDGKVPVLWKLRSGALQKRQKKLYMESVRALDQVLAMEPDNASLYFDLSIGYLYLKDLDSALSVLQLSVSKDLSYLLGFVEAAEIIETNGLHNSNIAINFAAEAQKFFNKNTKSAAHLGLGLEYLKTKNYRKAQIEYGNAVKAMLKSN